MTKGKSEKFKTKSFEWDEIETTLIFVLEVTVKLKKS